MKIDTLTGLSIAFAGFAAWYVLKPKAATPTAGSDATFAMASSQRKQVGGATQQNFSYLDGWAAPNLSRMGGAQGLQGPSSGFWA